MCALREASGCVGLPEVVVTYESALLCPAVPIQAGVITGAIIGVVLGLLLLIVVIYYLMRFLVARRVFSLSVRSVDSLWPASFSGGGGVRGRSRGPSPSQAPLQSES